MGSFLSAPVTLSIKTLVDGAIASVLELVLRCCAGMIDMFFGIISKIGLDTGIVYNLFPKLKTVVHQDIFIPLGWVIAVAIFGLGMLQFFFPFANKNSLPAPAPFVLIIRFIGSLVLIVFLTDLINEYVMPLATLAFESISSVDVVGAGTQWNFSEAIASIDMNGITSDEMVTFDQTAQAGNNPAATFFTSLLPAAAATPLGAAWIGSFLVLVLIMLIYLTICFVKFFMYHLEKLILAALMIYSAPLVAGTFTSKQTAPMLTAYFKLLLSNIITLIFNMLALKCTQAIAINGVTAMQTSGSTTYLLILLPLMSAALNVAKKMSTTVSQTLGVGGAGDTIRGAGVIATTTGLLSSAGFTLGALRHQMAENRQSKAAEASADNARGTRLDLHNANDAYNESLENFQNEHGRTPTTKEKDAMADKAIKDTQNAEKEMQQAEREAERAAELQAREAERTAEKEAQAEQRAMEKAQQFDDNVEAVKLDNDLTSEGCQELDNKINDHINRNGENPSPQLLKAYAREVADGAKVTNKADIASTRDFGTAQSTVAANRDNTDFMIGAQKVVKNSAGTQALSRYSSDYNAGLQKGLTPQQSVKYATTKFDNSITRPETKKDYYDYAVRHGASDETARKFATMKDKAHNA